MDDTIFYYSVLFAARDTFARPMLLRCTTWGTARHDASDQRKRVYGTIQFIKANSVIVLVSASTDVARHEALLSGIHDRFVYVFLYIYI